MRDHTAWGRVRQMSDQETTDKDSKSESAKPDASATASTISWRSWGTRIAKGGIPLTIIVALSYLIWFRPVQVIAHEVGRADLLHEIYGRGTIESERESQLGFDMVGRISELQVEEGDEVSLGQELAQLYSDTVDAEVKTARSSVSAARAALGRLAAEERKARAALSFAKTEEARAKNLLASKTVAAAEYDAAVQATRIARAELGRVLGSRREATRGIAVASSGVEQRKASALRSTLLAPFDGVVVRSFREPGDTVSVGSTVFRIVDTNALIVQAWIDETALSRLSEGQPVRARISGYSEISLGTLTSIGKEVDRQTHELLVEATLTDPPSNLVVGQRSEVFVEVERKSDVLTLPLAFLMRDAKGLHAFVSRDGKTKRVKIEVGITGREAIEVTSGLSAGDVVLRPAKAGKALKAGRRFRSQKP